MARTAQVALILSLALMLAACGRKGPLEAPGQPSGEQKQTDQTKPADDTDPNSPDRVLKTPHRP